MSDEPLVFEFEVAAAPAHAFTIWTARCALWWPPSHTLSGDPARITFEERSGGRIYETGPDGVEYDWGSVLAWEPPTRLRYRWHLFFTPAEATEVELSFTPSGAGTLVRLEQHGWERLGAAGAARRERTHQVWATLAPAFARAATG
jgi:uncharacterized protein YndB with AHSA1/START domain